MCGLGSLSRCILRTVTGSFVPVGDGGELHVLESSVLSDAIDTSCP